MSTLQETRICPLCGETEIDSDRSWCEACARDRQNRAHSIPRKGVRLYRVHCCACGRPFMSRATPRRNLLCSNCHGAPTGTHLKPASERKYLKPCKRCGEDFLSTGKYANSGTTYCDACRGEIRREARAKSPVRLPQKPRRKPHYCQWSKCKVVLRTPDAKFCDEHSISVRRENGRKSTVKMLADRAAGEYPTRFTHEQVREIRRRYAALTGRYGGVAALAEEYGCARQTIFHIGTRKTYTYVKD